MISAIAVHESAHAVCGWALGTPATKLTLRPPFCTYSDGTSAMWRGAAVTTRPPRTDRECWRVAALRTVAGALGEVRLTGERFPVALRRAKSDFAMAMIYADGLATASQSSEAVLLDLVCEARDIVDQNWDVVLRLARALDVSRALNGVEIARIIARQRRAL